MNKAFLIFAREYLAKVRNKTFLVATLIGPIFFLGIIVVPIWLDHETNQEVSIGVIDGRNTLLPLLKSDSQIRFQAAQTQSVNDLQSHTGSFENLLMIPDTLDLFKSSGITLYFMDNKGGKLEGQIKDRINKALVTRRFSQTGISQNKVDSLRSEARIRTIVMDDAGGGAADTTAASLVGLLFGMLTYLFIFLYGSQVMRSVIEEKTSRIVEIIITSVKPFQLLMGKILAVGAVGLTQFVIWVVAVSILFSVFGINPNAANRQGAGLAQTSVVKVQAPDNGKEPEKSFKTNEKTAAALRKLPATVGWFLLFFVGGFLLYSSMFAAIGSAVDQDGGETQQFMLPVTVPLIIAIAVSGAVINNPQSPMAFWMSMIPFTSPIIMMMRIPFGVPAWQILLSVGILFATFALMLYFSAKVYRIGIISYGKRFTFKDLWSWVRQA